MRMYKKELREQAVKLSDEIGFKKASDSKMGGGIPYDTIAEKLKRFGSNIYLNTAVKGIAVKDGKAIGIIDSKGKTKFYDYVVSTAPFTEMICSIDER